MPSLYIVLYQFGSETNAKNFVTNNSGIDATSATVTFASGIAEGSWVVTFPENLNQLPSGFSPVLTYNGNTQTYESFAPFIDLSTINVITIPDGTPIIYKGVPVTNLANGPTASVTGHWVPGVWDVQYIYPPPITGFLTLEAFVTVGAGTAYEFGDNNPPFPGLGNPGIRSPFPGVPYTQGGVTSAETSLNINFPGFSSPQQTQPGEILKTGSFLSGPARDYGLLPGDPTYGVYWDLNLNGTTITADAKAFPTSDYAWYFNQPLLLGVFALMAGAIALPGTEIMFDVSTITLTTNNTDPVQHWAFHDITGSQQNGNSLQVTFRMITHDPG